MRAYKILPTEQIKAALELELGPSCVDQVKKYASLASSSTIYNSRTSVNDYVLAGVKSEPSGACDTTTLESSEKVAALTTTLVYDSGATSREELRSQRLETLANEADTIFDRRHPKKHRNSEAVNSMLISGIVGVALGSATWIMGGYLVDGSDESRRVNKYKAIEQKLIA